MFAKSSGAQDFSSFDILSELQYVTKISLKSKGIFPFSGTTSFRKKNANNDISFTTSRSTKDPKLLPETWTFRLRKKLTGLGNPIPNKNPCFSWLIFEEMTTWKSYELLIIFLLKPATPNKNQTRNT